MRSIELFAGAGGLGMGLSAAGFEPDLVVEWDKWCCDTIRENRRSGNGYVASWPDPVQSDVREIDFRIFEGRVELVSGGPPCQPFSVGGRHRAHDDGRDMWSEAVRAVRETRPKAFIFENVKGLTRASFATYLAYIVHQLSHPDIVRAVGEGWQSHLGRLEQHHTSGSKTGLQYHVVWQVLNAADYGVPQRRERVVFVGFRSDLGVAWKFPEPTHSQDRLLWDQFRSADYWNRHELLHKSMPIDHRLVSRADKLKQRPKALPWQTVRDAISDLPDPTSSKSNAVSNHRFQPGAKAYPGHTGSPLDEAAKTLKAGVHGVPGGENMLLRHDGSVRYFTIRESARLQTFPDSYVLHGSWSEAMRQLGNAVPFELANVIAKAVARDMEQSCN